MPKPAHVEASETVNAGEYDAVIYQIIDIGHHTFPSGKKAHKYYFNLDIPEVKKTMPLSGFGIPNWDSPSKPPFIGMVELIQAVAKVPITKEEMAAFDLWTMIGKTIKVTIGENDKGFMNVLGVKPADKDIKTDKELLTFEIEDIDDINKLAQLDQRTTAQLQRSNEWQDRAYTTEGNEEKPEEIKLESIPF